MRLLQLLPLCSCTVLSCTVLSCTSSSGQPTDTGEGPAERDWTRLGGGTDTGDATGTGTGTGNGTTTGTSTWAGTATDPQPVGEVCYLGGDGSGTTCLPVVARSDAWGPSYDYPDPLSGDPQYTPPTRFVDLSSGDPAVDPTTMLGPNFQLDEFMAEYKGRFAVTQPHLIQTLQAMRDESGGALNVNSGYRNVSYNASVGGATWSRHQYGDAADLTSDVLDLDGLAALCESWGADYIGMYTAHVHCDWRTTPLDPAFYDVLYDLPKTRVAPPVPGPPTLQATLVASGDPARATWTAPATGFDEGEPLRQWTAWAADGSVLETATGSRYHPPAATAALSVRVGGQLQRQIRMD